MCIDSMLRKYAAAVRARAAKTLLVAGSALLVSLPSAALAQTQTVCGPEVKEEIVKALAGVGTRSEAEKLAVEAELYAKYQFCAQDGAACHRPSTSRRASAVRASPTLAASTTRR